MLDSRQTVRYAIDLPASLWVGETELAARIRNLSLGGVFIAGPTLPVGTRVKLRLDVPSVDAFETWCITRWTRADGCGLSFEGLQPMDTCQLARFIGMSMRLPAPLPDVILRPY